MNKAVPLLVVLLTCSIASAADATVRSIWAASDQPLNSDLKSSYWRGAVAIYMDSNPHGKHDPKYRTEIRARWTQQNMYFLFVCPYEELYLKPNPNTSEETNELWNWDGAEVFIGSDFQHIRRYKEFEMSPRGEWIDLDINLDKPHDENGWKWNSGFEVSARIDPAAHVWDGVVKIPYRAVDNHPAVAGNTLRINFFRSQGPASARHQIAWQAPMSNSFHVPERFGLMKLVKTK